MFLSVLRNTTRVKKKRINKTDTVTMNIMQSFMHPYPRLSRNA
jgi:hypothetical protein